jgi:glycosyltransferase involved in cell wall biosynthesis
MKISVALCTYNGAKYIKEQLNSILEQTLLPDEIVICDDSSTDDTLTIVRKVMINYCGELIVVVNSQNIGYKKNFVKAMTLCTGDIIFLSDQDDVWAKGKIALLTCAFEDNKSAVLVFHDAILVDEQLKLLYNSFWKILKFEPKNFLCHDYSILVAKNVIQGSACAFRRELFYEAIPFPIDAVHDEWLALMAVAQGEIIPIVQPLMKYRQSRDNVLGGLPIPFIGKVKNWTTNIKNGVSYHFQKLQDREAVYDAYSKKNRNNTELVKKIDFIGCSNFFKRRVLCIENRDLSIIKLLPRYFHIYICKHYAIKMFLRDLLTIYFYDKKSL